MGTSASLPLPAGATVAVPARSVAQAWAAPRAADLVLDPWAAPVGPPIAQLLISPWPAPDASMRIVTMPPPAALVAVADLATSTASMSASTRDAIDALNSASMRSAVVRDRVSTPSERRAAATDTTPAAATKSDAIATPTGRLRAKMWAMIAGGAVAAAGLVTVVATAF
ncbi:MAG: hypothetical protein AAGG08_00455 [Actinomycetota bacterium]